VPCCNISTPDFRSLLYRIFLVALKGTPRAFSFFFLLFIANPMRLDSIGQTFSPWAQTRVSRRTIRSIRGRLVQAQLEDSTPHEGPQHHPRPLELPGGGFWWVGLKNDRDVVYGEHFVIQRPKVGGEGLVRRDPLPPPQRFMGQQSGLLASTAHVPVKSGPLGLLPSLVVIDTEAVTVLEVEGGEEERSHSVNPKPNSTCLDIVPFSSSAVMGPEEGNEGAVSKHKRRTKQVRASCFRRGGQDEALSSRSSYPVCPWHA
jgi:hypothetical protein